MAYRKELKGFLCTITLSELVHQKPDLTESITTQVTVQGSIYTCEGSSLSVAEGVKDNAGHWCTEELHLLCYR